MAEVEVPTYRDLMYPTLVALRELGGSASNSEIEETVPAVAGLTQQQMAVEFPAGTSHEGKSKVLYQLSWSRTYLRAIGALENSERRVWSITTKGIEYLNLGPEEGNEALRKADSAQRAEWRTRASMQTDEEQSDEPDDWRDLLLKTLKDMDPAGFERLSMRLLREAGFRNVEVKGKSGDGGIDGVGVYKVSLVSFPTYFQCKRYSGSVSAGVVRDFRGAMTGRGEKGLIITTGVFTPAAISEATRDGAPPIDLIGGDDLCELLKEFRLGVEVEERTVEDVTVRCEFFDTV